MLQEALDILLPAKRNTLVFVDVPVFLVLPGGNAVGSIVGLVEECLHNACDRIFLRLVLLCD